MDDPCRGKDRPSNQPTEVTSVSEILPDSRPIHTTGSKMLNGAWWAPIFCANCGDPGGMVPEENMTFIFWLCQECFDTHGEITKTHVMPDEVFWEKVKQEQLAAYGRFLTEQELAGIVAADASPLATLLKE